MAGQKTPLAQQLSRVKDLAAQYAEESTRLSLELVEFEDLLNGLDGKTEVRVPIGDEEHERGMACAGVPRRRVL